MTWTPTEAMDREIRRWMKAKGWEVNCRPEYGRKVYGWRHQVRGGPSPTLRIAQTVLEDYPPFAVLHHLDELKVAAAIRARPDARYVVAQNGSSVALQEVRSGKAEARNGW